MKTIISLLITFLIAGMTHAATSHEPKIFVCNSRDFVAGFPRPDQNDKALIIRTDRKTSLFSWKELDIELIGVTDWSTGSSWCQGAIGYVTHIKIKNDETTQSIEVFYFRHRSGKEIAVNLETNELIDIDKIYNKEELNKKTIEKAASLLKSDKPRDQWTAAIHLGQLKGLKYLPELEKLLSSEASYAEEKGDYLMVYYYVRVAAKKAIQQIQKKDDAN